MNNNLSENLKKIRKDNNLSQEQLAEELGVSRQAISKWESGIAYPEMDKIIQLCNKFELNIDDLLNKDIREIKGEEISKRNINNIIDSFLKFITDTINLFYNMSFKSKIKCIFEQLVISFILFIIFMCMFGVLDSTIGSLIRHLPDSMYGFVLELLRSIFVIFCIVASIGIIVHIFKTRYLDYYEKIKNSSNDEDSNEKDIEFEDKKNNESTEKNNKILFKRNEDKIIIRDPKHSEYRFVHSIFKIFVLGIKFFALLLLGIFCISLVGLFAGFIASFIIRKTGILFIGLLFAFLSIGIINIVVLLLLLNFIFNRKNDKKKMIWSFIVSLIVLGLSIGLIFLGSLKFDYLTYDKNNDELVSNTINIVMKDNTSIGYFYNDIEYIEENIDNIRVEVKTNKFVSATYNITDDGSVHIYTYNPNFKNLFDYVIKNLNNYKVVEFDSSIYEIKVYASKSNIEKLKNNLKIKKEKEDEERELRNQYENTINEYESKLQKYEEKVSDLEYKICVSFPDDELCR